jgi:hypothetical protein
MILIIKEKEAASRKTKVSLVNTATGISHMKFHVRDHECLNQKISLEDPKFKAWAAW